MARKIDESKPLSDKDRAWLEERGEYGRIQLIDAIHGKSEDALSEEDAARIALAAADREAAAEEAARISAEDNAADEVNYEEMTVEELRDELESRELSKSGNKADLIARLQEDDESA